MPRIQKIVVTQEQKAIQKQKTIIPAKNPNREGFDNSV
jgi:hypothetical protein